MFTKPLEYLFLPSALDDAYDEISKSSSGIDGVEYETFEKAHRENIDVLSAKVLEGRYAPEPLKKIEIDKPDSDEKRPIALSAIKDKIVQRVLYDNLNSYFDKRFSDKSYAYRPDKSTLKAINQTTVFINQKNLFIVKTDIDNFFESIDHNLLLELLTHHIKDRRIIRLISLFLQTGGFKGMEYDPHFQGIHQGDILSPLLSNIYLNEMDLFLEKREVPFVRYADDFVMLFKSKQEAYKMLKEVKRSLKSLHLKLEKEKTSVTHISEGFTFLGVDFIGRNRSVQEQRLQRSVEKILSFSQDKRGFKIFVDDLNTYLHALKNYYLKIISKNATQHQRLQNALIDTMAHKVFLSKSSKTLTTKKAFKSFLEQVHLHLLFDDPADVLVTLAIARGYERYLSEKSYKDTSTKIARKKNKYAKKFADDATLHVVSKGVMLGVSKNRFVIKEYGRVKARHPLNKVKRIILEGRGFSLSSDVIKKCADHAISIDFIDSKAFAYASLNTYKASGSQIIQKQALTLNTPLQLTLAQEFIRGKAKNQLNYLKYINKYHKLLDRQIDAMAVTIGKLKSAQSIETLMGYEGSISASYWDALRMVIDVPFEKRITLGARDVVNTSLNYGYAILYGQVQHALVYAGLSLNISFLHTMDAQKPTLTFDMIEEFRTFVVDRTVISMLNKDEPLKLGSDGLLTKSSRQLLAKNVKERLGAYTMHKKESKKIENIIQSQAFLLAKTIKGESKKYKAFIGKF